MKKISFILALIILVNSLLVFTVAAEGNDEIKIYVENNLVSFDVKPYIDLSGRTLVPIRFVAENLNCTVEWRAKDQTIIIREDNGNLYYKIAYLKIGRKEVYTDSPFLLDTPPVLKDGRTMIPLRAMAELFNKAVNWDASTRTISISTLDVLPTTIPKPTPKVEPPVESHVDNSYIIEGSKFDESDTGSSYRLPGTNNVFFVNQNLLVESAGSIHNMYDGTLEKQAMQMISIISSKYELDDNAVLAYALTHTKKNYKLYREFSLENTSKVLLVSSENTADIGFVVK